MRPLDRGKKKTKGECMREIRDYENSHDFHQLRRGGGADLARGDSENGARNWGKNTPEGLRTV